MFFNRRVLDRSKIKFPFVALYQVLKKRLKCLLLLNLRGCIVCEHCYTNSIFRFYKDFRIEPLQSLADFLLLTSGSIKFAFKRLSQSRITRLNLLEGTEIVALQQLAIL